MNTKLYDYVKALTDCYYTDYEDLELVKKMCIAFEEFEKAGIDKEKDSLLVYAMNNNMLTFQNPVIKDIISEIKSDSKYKEYVNGNTKIKGYLIGQVMKKYPACDIENISQLI